MLGLLFESDNYLAQGLELLEVETGKQVLPDGGHVSRNRKPSY